MKLKDKQQLVSLSKTELMVQVRDLKKQMKEIELNKYIKQTKNVRAITALRLKVAMMKTQLNGGSVTEVVKEK